MNEQGPETLLEAVRHFSDLKVCNDYMIALKWPDGHIICPKCGSDKIGRIATRSMLRCNAKGCRKQFSVKVGTIFEESPLGLDKWFVAVWSIANAKNGISSCEVGRALGITQKSAWFMLHRIRLAMKTNTFRKLTGKVESDETFIGGEAKNMHKSKKEKKILGRGGVGKAIVHGLLERGDKSKDKASSVHAAVIPNTEQGTLMTEIRANVDKNATIYTDSSQSYVNVILSYIHATVDHGREYIKGRAHTNGLENFFSLLKRALRGSYVAVAAYHLFRYVDEEIFRFNERKGTDGTRFHSVMGRVLGKRLTFRQLCAIGDAGFMGIQ